VLRGDTVTYSFEITNLTGDELSLLVTDRLPDGVTFEQSQNPEWGSSFGPNLIGRSLSVPAGQTTIIGLQVSAVQSGVLVNSATLVLRPPGPPSPSFTILGYSETETEVRELCSLSRGAIPMPPSLTACQTALDTALPDPATAADKKEKRVAKRLRKFDRKGDAALGRAAAATGRKQEKQYGKAERFYGKLLAAARSADASGRLGVPLAPIEEAAGGLLEAIPG
jgi:uncharacterized repeat protein (TIGR01451 family)